MTQPGPLPSSGIPATDAGPRNKMDSFFRIAQIGRATRSIARHMPKIISYLQRIGYVFSSCLTTQPGGRSGRSMLYLFIAVHI